MIGVFGYDEHSYEDLDMAFEFPSVMLDRAVINGDLAKVERILPMMEKWVIWEAMETAINRGKTDIVRVMIPYVDVKKDKSVWLQYASLWKQQDIFDLLYPLSDPQEALLSMQAKIFTGKFSGGIDMLAQRLKAQEEHQIISDSVEGTNKIERKAKTWM